MCITDLSGIFPIRLVSPLIAIGIAGYYFLPETSGNIVALTRRLEAKVPIVWDTHQKHVKDSKQVKQEAAREVKS